MHFRRLRCSRGKPRIQIVSDLVSGKQPIVQIHEFVCAFTLIRGSESKGLLSQVLQFGNHRRLARAATLDGEQAHSFPEAWRITPSESFVGQEILEKPPDTRA